jgi:hypothetical protein
MPHQNSLPRFPYISVAIEVHSQHETQAAIPKVIDNIGLNSFGYVNPFYYVNQNQGCNMLIQALN